MIEGTGGIEFLLPVILAIVLSNWVAHHIHSAGAYESDLERIGTIRPIQFRARILIGSILCLQAPRCCYLFLFTAVTGFLCRRRSPFSAK